MGFFSQMPAPAVEDNDLGSLATLLKNDWFAILRAPVRRRRADVRRCVSIKGKRIEKRTVRRRPRVVTCAVSEPRIHSFGVNGKSLSR